MSLTKWIRVSLTVIFLRLSIAERFHCVHLKRGVGIGLGFRYSVGRSLDAWRLDLQGGRPQLVHFCYIRPHHLSSLAKTPNDLFRNLDVASNHLRSIFPRSIMLKVRACRRDNACRHHQPLASLAHCIHTLSAATSCSRTLDDGIMGGNSATRLLVRARLEWWYILHFPLSATFSAIYHNALWTRSRVSFDFFESFHISYFAVSFGSTRCWSSDNV